ncbi:MAG: ParB N-terminal domain-containing protein [Gaiellaceae bacterium]
MPFERLRPESSVFPRRAFDRQRIAQFVDLYQAGGVEALPLVELVPLPGGDYLIADGMHRLSALNFLQAEAVPALIAQLEPDDDPFDVAYRRALWCAAASAKPLTRVEKRDAILRLASADPPLSDREIGRLVGVDHKTVARQLRTNVEPDPSLPSTAGSGAAARRAVRDLSRLYDAVGPRRENHLHGGSAGERLARIFTDAFTSDALRQAARLREWIDDALRELERRPDEES